MFYDKFLVLCEENGVSPSSLLETLKISKGGLKRWRDGQEPSNKIKKKIADYFGLTVLELMGKKEKPAAQKGDELAINAELKSLLISLTPEQAEKVRVFIAGMKAERG